MRVFNPVWASRDGLIVALKIGPLSINPAVNLEALGFSPLFDLRHSYWLLQGIAGVTPLHGTIGSAIWADFVVDGDAVHELTPGNFPQDGTRAFIHRSRTALIRLPGFRGAARMTRRLGRQRDSGFPPAMTWFD